MHIILCKRKSISHLDVDECAGGSHICSMLCVNTPGSYHCACPDGYELDNDGITCHGQRTMQQCFMSYQWPPDIDECEQMTSGCQHSFTNTIGSFKCTCDLGYILSANGFSCEGNV